MAIIDCNVGNDMLGARWSRVKEEVLNTYISMYIYDVCGMHIMCVCVSVFTPD